MSDPGGNEANTSTAVAAGTPVDQETMTGDGGSTTGNTADSTGAATDDATTTKTKNKKRWFPLESNPSLLNRYIDKLGFDSSIYEFVDVYSTEQWALDMIPQPVAAVIVLYPLTEKQEEFRAKEKADKVADNTNNNVWHITQRIGNACGTIGILHALGNLPEGLRSVAIRDPSWLRNFYDVCPPPLDSAAKADVLEQDTVLETLHEEAASDRQAQTDRGNVDDRVLTHFIALVHADGGLYELDGRKDGPIRHGGTTEMTFLADACKVVEQFMKRDPGELRFTIMALAPKQG